MIETCSVTLKSVVTGPAPWTWDLYSPRDPRLKGPHAWFNALCHCLIILHFSMRGPYFHFAPGPANYLTRTASHPWVTKPQASFLKTQCLRFRIVFFAFYNLPGPYAFTESTSPCFSESSPENTWCYQCLPGFLVLIISSEHCFKHCVFPVLQGLVLWVPVCGAHPGFAANRCRPLSEWQAGPFYKEGFTYLQHQRLFQTGK